MTITLGEKIKSLRKKNGFSQEQLATKFGISVQAVSKWECAASYPDIELLPAIADLFQVSIDYLFRESKPLIHSKLANDGVFRIIQCIGDHILQADEYDPDLKIPLVSDFSSDLDQKHTQIEIWGNADIDGDVFGDLSANSNIYCNDVNGDVHANDSINCTNVNGDVHSSASVNCTDVAGDIHSDGGVNCSNISGDVSGFKKINCGNIKGDITDCSGDIHCDSIKGDITNFSGNIYCSSIDGDVTCSGDIIYQSLEH